MARRCEKMHPADSYEWAHSVLWISSIYTFFLTISMIFVGIGLYFYSKEFVVSPENLTDKYRNRRLEFTNNTQITYDEVIAALNPLHPLHSALDRRHVRYNFGTTYFNHCHMFPYPNVTSLPSILRRMTFSSDAQASMRTAVLITVLWRMLVILIRTSDLILQNPAKRCKICCIGFLCGLADFMVSTFGMFVTCLHHIVDANNLKFLVKYSLPIFGASFFACATLYTILESYDINRKNSRLVERAFYIALFAFCMPIVCKDYFSFILTKPCLYHAEWMPAFSEYICIIIIIIYYFTQIEDFTKMQLVLSCEKEETMCCMDFIDITDFKPAMLHDFHKLRESQKAAAKLKFYKSVIFVHPNQYNY